MAPRTQNQNTPADQIGATPISVSTPAPDVENTAASTGAPNDAAGIAERKDVIESQVDSLEDEADPFDGDLSHVPKPKPGWSQVEVDHRYLVISDMVGERVRGQLIDLSGNTPAERKRLLKLKAIRRPTADEIQAAEEAEGIDADVDDETDDSDDE